jgi:hypothetical protein
MIILFEPQCRGLGHEQFNAGFLYGYLLAYPEERIVFFGEKEHIKCVKAVFSSANLAFNKVEFVEVEIPNPDLLASVFEYLRIWKGLLSYAYINDCNKIVLLSIHTYNLIPLKYLLQFKYSNSIQVHIAMHGIFEAIKRKNFLFLLEFFQKAARFLGKFLGKINRRKRYEIQNRYLYEKLFKISLHVFSNKNITYFVFREDSLEKIKKYLPKIHQYFKSIDLPYIYKNVEDNAEMKPSNIIIFVTFEKGHADELEEIVRVLTQNTASAKKIEIRIIGGNVNKKLSNSEQIKYIGDSGKLLREEIEEQIKDAQYFLLFYPHDSYELTSSGLFFDAIAYRKPVIFLENYCLGFYYNKYKFGFRCNNVDEMIYAMKRIILSEGVNYQGFVSEIMRMQQDTAVSNNYYKLKFNEELIMNIKKILPG